MTRLLSTLFAAKTPARTTRRARLGVECLDGRILPSATWHGAPMSVGQERPSVGKFTLIEANTIKPFGRPIAPDQGAIAVEPGNPKDWYLTLVDLGAAPATPSESWRG